MKDIVILAIESSCDETSAAIIINGELKSNIVASQIDIHSLYGGVVPEIASRNHILKISEVVNESLVVANISKKEINAVAVTYGPGLVGALLVGVSFAKAYAYALGVPLIGTNHMAGHISANYLSGAKPPFMCLITSGGHTMVVKVKSYTDFEVLGSTKDDAAGEAFDKVARVIGLAYPGGPKLDMLADEGDVNYLKLPRVMLKDDNYDFSFSGLKSAVLNHINSCKMKDIQIDKAGLCASFRECVCEILVGKIIKSAKNENISHIAISGGVACNSRLRKMLSDECEKNGFKLSIPEKIFCSDNAAMIGAMAYRQYLNNDFCDMNLNAVPYLKL